MQKVIGVLLFVTMTVPGLIAQMAASRSEVSKTEEDKRAEEEVRALSVEEVQGFLNKDPKALNRLWSDDMVVTNPLNKFVTKQQVLGMVASGFLVIASFHRQIDYLRVYGDTVIVAGSETALWGGRMPNAGKTEHLRFTAIWMKQRGRWQEVARHANIVPQQ
jgi:ketosteroid isomerase-like protein